MLERWVRKSPVRTVSECRRNLRSGTGGLCGASGRESTSEMMVDSSLAQIGKNLSEAMSILGDEQREPQTEGEKAAFSWTSIPGPLQRDGQDAATIVHQVHNLIHEKMEGEEPLCQQVQSVGEQGHMALLGHSLAAYISMLDRERLRRLSTRILSDTTLWLCRLFRYENASVCFHEDDRDGLVKVCRLLLNARYEEFACEGYTVLSSKQPVIYQSASCRPGLGQHTCSQLGLPLSSLCTVPCNTVFGSQHQMDVALLDKLIQEDSDAGKLPLLLIANAGTPGAGHTDKLSRLRELCDQHGMWLHVEGVNLATLVLAEVSSAVTAATRSDSMTLTPGRWLGLPAVPSVTLYRHEDPALSLAAGLTSSQPVEKLRALPLWLSLQYLGHNGIVEKISHATALSKHLLMKLKPLASIRTSVEDDLSSPVVLFRFSQDMSGALGGRSGEALCAGEKEVLETFNRWLGEQLSQMVSSCGVDVVELEDEGPCVRFSPLLTAAVLGTQQEDVDRLVDRLTMLVPVMSSTVCLRQDFREETHRRAPLLMYVEESAWPGLGAVRFEPQADGMDESRRKHELQKINYALLKKLQDLDTDIIFSTGPETGMEQNCVYVGLVTEDVDISELVDTIAAFGREIEENGRLLENMTEVVRKGILEAEQQLQKASEDKLLEEGLLRQLPVVGSVLNWLSPVQSSIKGRTFNLAAGSLDSTDTTYLTKAQAERISVQDTPTSSSKRSAGQRLFRRFNTSETSSSNSTDAAEDWNLSPQSSSSHLDTSPTTSDTSQHTLSDVIAEETEQEDTEREDTDQDDAEQDDAEQDDAEQDDAEQDDAEQEDAEEEDAEDVEQEETEQEDTEQDGVSQADQGQS